MLHRTRLRGVMGYRSGNWDLGCICGCEERLLAVLWQPRTVEKCVSVLSRFSSEDWIAYTTVSPFMQILQPFYPHRHVLFIFCVMRRINIDSCCQYLILWPFRSSIIRQHRLLLCYRDNSREESNFWSIIRTLRWVSWKLNCQSRWRCSRKNALNTRTTWSDIPKQYAPSKRRSTVQCQRTRLIRQRSAASMHRLQVCRVQICAFVQSYELRNYSKRVVMHCYVSKMPSCVARGALADRCSPQTIGHELIASRGFWLQLVAIRLFVRRLYIAAQVLS